MQTILRHKFPETPLDAALLEAVGGLSLAWLDQARTVQLLPRHSFHRVQAHLWGVPRASLETCRVELGRYANRQLPDSSVELSDPDTLTITTTWREISQPWALARLAGLFVALEYEGMRLTLRVTAGEWRGTPDGRPLKEATLVIWTELRDGVAHLKGTWPADLSGRGETAFYFTVWAGEESFWKAVGEFRTSRDAPARPERLFISPARQRLRRASRWLQVDVGGQRTLGAFLVRLATFGSIATAGVAAIGLVRSLPVFVLAAPLTLVSARWFLKTLFKKLRNVANFHGRMRTRLREVYSRPLNYLPVNLDEAGPWPEAATAKYTREAENLGCVHWRDICRGDRGDLVSFVRIFALPSERMYLYLTLLHSTKTLHHFPVKAWFMSATYFTDGARLLLTNEQGGYGPSRDPQTVQRFFPEADLAELLELRRAIVQRLVAEGKELAPLMSTDELLARMEADHVRIGESARRQGYFTWNAAIRQSFHLTRPEYRRRW
jgi:hypothetical protein